MGLEAWSWGRREYGIWSLTLELDLEHARGAGAGSAAKTNVLDSLGLLLSSSMMGVFGTRNSNGKYTAVANM